MIIKLSNIWTQAGFFSKIGLLPLSDPDDCKWSILGYELTTFYVK